MYLSNIYLYHSFHVRHCILCNFYIDEVLRTLELDFWIGHSLELSIVYICVNYFCDGQMCIVYTYNTVLCLSCLCQNLFNYKIKSLFYPMHIFAQFFFTYKSQPLNKKTALWKIRIHFSLSLRRRFTQWWSILFW